MPYQPVGHDSALSQPPALGPTRRIVGSLFVRRGKSIVGTLLAMFIVADIGVNAAHNTGAAVSRMVPVIHDRPFHFDPFAIVHDAENVLH